MLFRMSEPQYQLRMIACSTSPHAPFAVLNGPIARQLGVGTGRGEANQQDPGQRTDPLGRPQGGTGMDAGDVGIPDEGLVRHGRGVDRHRDANRGPRHGQQPVDHAAEGEAQQDQHQVGDGGFAVVGAPDDVVQLAAGGGGAAAHAVFVAGDHGQLVADRAQRCLSPRELSACARFGASSPAH